LRGLSFQGGKVSAKPEGGERTGTLSSQLAVEGRKEGRRGKVLMGVGERKKKKNFDSTSGRRQGELETG